MNVCSFSIVFGHAHTRSSTRVSFCPKYYCTLGVAEVFEAILDFVVVFCFRSLVFGARIFTDFKPATRSAAPPKTDTRTACACW
jgi:hypothetical protein